MTLGSVYLFEKLAAFEELAKVAYYFCQIKVVIVGSICFFPTIYVKPKLEVSKNPFQVLGFALNLPFSIFDWKAKLNYYSLVPIRRHGPISRHASRH